MKNPAPSQVCPRRRSSRAFTLIELMVVVAIFAMLMAAMVSSQLYGLRVAALGANQASMTTYGRQTMNQIRDAVRGAQTLYVGSCSSTNPASFSPSTTAQQGGALQVFSTTNLGPPYVIYYLDNSNARTNYLKSYTVNTTNGAAVTAVLAAYMTNTVVFYAEDFQGNVLTNNSNNRVIDVLLKFNQYAFINRGNTVQGSYQLRTRVTQRTLNAN